MVCPFCPRELRNHIAPVRPVAFVENHVPRWHHLKARGLDNANRLTRARDRRPLAHCSPDEIGFG
jgi:hypothetical protein